VARRAERQSAFWAHPERLTKLLGARVYRDSIHDVLVVDTARFVDAHQDRIRLAGMNTGATVFPSAPKRGSDIFQRIESFPFDERRRAPKALVDNIVEVCLLDGLHDVTDSVIRVERRKGMRRLNQPRDLTFATMNCLDNSHDHRGHGPLTSGQDTRASPLKFEDPPKMAQGSRGGTRSCC